MDGKNVSVRYRGQTKYCARCHKAETKCSGKGLARDCTSDRVLHSLHMQENWKNIAFTPDSSTVEEVDEDFEINVQVGARRPEGPDLTRRYNTTQSSLMDSCLQLR